ncbi:MAG: hypothetical protein WA081_11105, partial [Desulfosalsimonadaceae bacterium]
MKLLSFCQGGKKRQTYDKISSGRQAGQACLAIVLLFMSCLLFAGLPQSAHSAVLWSDNFESGWGDWYADYGSWEVGVPTSGPGGAYNGTQCAATNLDGNYGPNVSSRLISPVFEVPSAGESPRLRFWHWWDN